MKLFFVVFVAALALSAQDPQSPKKQTPPPPKAATKAAPKVTDASKPTAIPAEAVQAADGDSPYPAPEGKKWIFRKTPFGVARLEDPPERTAAKAAAAD